MTKREAKMVKLLADFCNWHCSRLGEDRTILRSNTDAYTERAFDILDDIGCSQFTGMNDLEAYHIINWGRIDKLLEEATE